MIPIPRDFRDFIALLNARRVRYLIVGGYAVGIVWVTAVAFGDRLAEHRRRR